MNLIVSTITMVDLTNKEAKRINFSPNKNLLTSEHNHLGKSVIMKSMRISKNYSQVMPRKENGLTQFIRAILGSY